MALNVTPDPFHVEQPSDGDEPLRRLCEVANCLLMIPHESVHDAALSENFQPGGGTKRMGKRPLSGAAGAGDAVAAPGGSGAPWVWRHGGEEG